MGARAVLVSDWDKRPPRGGTAVVIDVIRFSTTVCALLESDPAKLIVAEDPAQLLKAKDIGRADIYSELEFKSPGRKYDNSPAQALRRGKSKRPVYITTTTGSKAAWASRRAEHVIIGCFANFSAVLDRLAGTRGKIWLVPAAAPFGRNMIEDELCARALVEALRGKSGVPEKAIRAVRNSGRLNEFLAFRPKGAKDLDLCLGLDRFPCVPLVRRSGRIM